ncbi:MAG: methionine synthase [Muribaculaceae bacterium]|nr:methionine synthase [Muribaculaceae bacterium]
MILNRDKFNRLSAELKEKIMILDGAMGSEIQRLASNGEAEAILPEMLNHRHPDLIKSIHTSYLEAGADIIETNSFNSNKFSLADYGLENQSYELSRTAAQIARSAADEFMRAHPGSTRYVAGSVGPTKLMLSLADSDSDFSFDSLAEAFKVQISGLLDGGADIILLETVFDTLTVKAALYALSALEEERGEKIPVIVSGTISDGSGRLLCGQSVEAFYASVRHFGLLAIGLNCGLGSGDMLSYLRDLAAVADIPVVVYPNAGLPDDCGCYHESPEIFAANVKEIAEEGLVNMAGGCCGTTPGHIKALSEALKDIAPRTLPDKRHRLLLSNRDLLDVTASHELIQVGERTNVAGSKKFARLIREGNFDEALDIAAKQVQAGAAVIDICMDDGLENTVANMNGFLSMINSDGETGSVPVMIDSSDWNVIVNALKRNPGKGIVNSISLKEGEKDFIAKAREIQRLGAAAVVMLFDEQGQADTFERKCRVAERAYTLLVQNGFQPEDIIIDPNVLTVGVSLSGRDTLGLDFIRAVEWIKQNLPYVSVSGGISNLSFAFRGNNKLREAMHSAFLYHASKVGLDMAIVNAASVSLYHEIDPELLRLVEDVILSRHDDAVKALVAFAEKMVESKDSRSEEVEIELPLDEKISMALRKGKQDEIESLVLEAVKDSEAIDVIQNILLPGMNEVGTLFSEGKMFLPQVIKSAQTMKRAVDALSPYLKGSAREKMKGRVVIATVKGDVHDIGKNIVSLVASANGVEIIDLGIRVEAEKIAEAAVANNVDAVLLSGLISPSLHEMIVVCKALNKRGLSVPVIVGGAATSEMHTALRIAPEYAGAVFYSPDAATNFRILSALISEDKTKVIDENTRRQEFLRNLYNDRRNDNANPSAGSKSAPSINKNRTRITVPADLNRVVYRNFPVEKVEPFINWEWIALSLDMSRAQKLMNADELAAYREKVIADAKRLLDYLKKEKAVDLQGVSQIFPAVSDGDDIILTLDNSDKYSLPMLRAEGGKHPASVADFLAESADYLALFVVGATGRIDSEIKRFNEEGDYYSAILTKLVADRLAEAFAEYIHFTLARNQWGFQKDLTVEEFSAVKGVRLAFGYPAVPDHSLKRDVFRLLDVEAQTDLRLTESDMIIPSEAVCGLILEEGEYMDVGKISDSQLEAYAAKRGVSLERIREMLPNNLAR